MQSSTKTKKATKRGRPREFDEQAVLDKMTDVFWENGYAATSLDMLSEASSLTRPSLYGAFGSKRQIFQKTQLRFCERLIERLDAALTTKDTLSAALHAFFVAAVQIYTAGGQQSKGCYVFNIGVADINIDLEQRAFTEQLLASAEDHLLRYLATAQTRRELKPEADLRAISKLCITLLAGISTMARGGTSQTDLHHVIAIAVQIISGAETVDPPM